MSSLAVSGTRGRRHGRTFAIGVAVVVASVGLVALGRWEGRRSVAADVRGIEHVRALVGPLDSPTLSGYRELPGFDCLVYRRGKNAYALELCVDPRGRVVEAIDRRRFERKIYDLHYAPSESTLSVERGQVNRLLARMQAPGF